MKLAKFYLSSGLILIFLLSSGWKTFAQPHANSWINYSQDYVKITVSDSSIYQIPISSLPTDFQDDINRLQLWHRGKQVAISFSSGNTHIRFYGVGNDGNSDTFLFKNPDTHEPDPSQRLDTYFSIFTDRSAYFLTLSNDSNPGNFKRIGASAALPISGTVEPYHWATEVRSYKDNYAYSAPYNFVSPSYYQSYFRSGNGVTSIIHGKVLGAIGTTYTLTPYNPYVFQGKAIFANGDPQLKYHLTNLYKDPDNPAALVPQVDLLIYGRTLSQNNITVQVLKNNGANVRNITDNMVFGDFVGVRKQFPLVLSADPNSSDVESNDSLRIRLFSNITKAPKESGLYSITYAKVTFPQSLNMGTATSKYFNLPAASNAQSRILIQNVAANSLVWDVTDKTNPIALNGNFSGGNFEIVVPRTIAKPMTILVANTSKNVTGDAPKKFVSRDPADFDYLILASDHLIGEVRSASGYLDYRNSPAGGSFNAMAKGMTEVYDEFNYGEISPVAIRNFVNFMISEGVHTRHNLLLVGHSESIGDNIVTNQYLPNQVPTYGYPGSDASLIENLGPDASLYVPAIPIGRITATTTQQVAAYLAKVKVYESTIPTAAAWRKKAITINGGKFAGESAKWNNTYFGANLNPLITSPTFGGDVTHYAKPTNDFTEPVPLNISDAVNAGVGFMAYFGHGNPHYMDNNIGYATDVNRLYNPAGKFPFMYFNGCGVGNIFKGSTVAYTKNSGFDPNINTNDRILPEEVLSVSADWLLAPGKGAIAMIANSYYAYDAASYEYLRVLYQELFTKDDANRKTVGQIHKYIASVVKPASGGGIRVAAVDPTVVLNTNQSTLQGDPAIKLLITSDGPLPVDLTQFKATYMEDNKSIHLQWSTSSEKNNSHFVIERSADAKEFTAIGTVKGNGDTNVQSHYQFFDGKPLPGINYYRLAQLDIANEGVTEGDKNYSNIISALAPYSENYRVFPNPTKDKVEITLKGGQGLNSWKLMDPQGRVVKTGKTGIVNISELPTGLYLIQVTTNTNEIFSKTIVRE